MLWVHATLVETSLAAYGRFVRPLAPDEEERYYREMAIVARLFGTPAAVIPAGLADFREYICAQLAGRDLCVTDPAREVAAVVLAARLPPPLRLLASAHRLSTAALLPARLRQEYGLGWSRAHAAALALATGPLRVAATPLFLAATHTSPAAARLRPEPSTGSPGRASSGCAGDRGGIVSSHRAREGERRALSSCRFRLSRSGAFRGRGS
jgi:uncharacterized protein (DUF2236 family)